MSTRPAFLANPRNLLLLIPLALLVAFGIYVSQDRDPSEGSSGSERPENLLPRTQVIAPPERFDLRADPATVPGVHRYTKKNGDAVDIDAVYNFYVDWFFEDGWVIYFQEGSAAETKFQFWEKGEDRVKVEVINLNAERDGIALTIFACPPAVPSNCDSPAE